MDKRHALNEISRILKVDARDAPRTLERFKKEIAEMGADLRKR